MVLCTLSKFNPFLEYTLHRKKVKYCLLSNFHLSSHKSVLYPSLNLFMRAEAKHWFCKLIEFKRIFPTIISLFKIWRFVSNFKLSMFLNTCIYSWFLPWPDESPTIDQEVEISGTYVNFHNLIYVVVILYATHTYVYVLYPNRVDFWKLQIIKIISQLNSTITSWKIK